MPMIPVIDTDREDNSAEYENRFFSVEMINTSAIKTCILSGETTGRGLEAPIPAIVTTKRGVYVTFASYLTKEHITDADIVRLREHKFSDEAMDFLETEKSAFEFKEEQK